MLEFTRLLSQENINPYDAIKWTKQDITGKDFECLGAEFPESWNHDACNIMAKKYFRQSRVTTEKETSVRQTFSRIVNAIAKAGLDQGYFDSANAIVFADELTTILLRQLALFNSPVLFNVGIPGLDTPLASACFINSVNDNMESILDLVKTEGLIFKEGAGSGCNFSRLRASSESIRGGGHASGPVSFLSIYDAAASVILSGGRTRRAAKMCILDADHPDIEAFVQSKAKQEDLVQVMVEAGLSPKFDDPNGAYAIAKLQNENHSVRLTDALMKKVREVLHGYKDDDTWDLINRADGSVAKTVSVATLFKGIAEAAHKSGDPGIQFHDTFNRFNTCANDGEIISTNPCVEFAWLENSACNLASLNLDRFLLPDRSWDFKTFKHVIRLVLTAQDILIDFAGYPTELIRENSSKYRPLGMGFTNLGGMLMSLGLAYDSDEGRNIAAAVTSLMTGQAYLTSTELASVKGPFNRFDANRGPMEDVLGKHVGFTRALKRDGAGISAKALTVWREAMSTGFGKKQEDGTGFRNCQVTVIAPAGTISFVMGAATTGIEPEFGLKKTKAMVGGDVVSYLNPNIEKALIALGYDDPTRGELLPYVAEHGHFEGSKLKPEHLSVFDCSMPIKNRCLSVDAHIEMVAAVQPFISGAISKTFNMKHDATVKEIQLTFLKAWERGIKGITIYRSGSKLSEPLRVAEVLKQVKKPLACREELPDGRESYTHKFIINGYTGYMTIGYYPDGRPGELFLRMAKPGSMVSGLLDSFATSCSFLLQYGVPLEVLVRRFESTKFSPAGITGNPNIPFAESIIDYVFRWLKKRFLTAEAQKEVDSHHAKKVEETTQKSPESDYMDYDLSVDPCPTCGSAMVKTGTCSVCIVCSHSSGVCS